MNPKERHILDSFSTFLNSSFLRDLIRISNTHHLIQSSQTKEALFELFKMLQSNSEKDIEILIQTIREQSKSNQLFQRFRDRRKICIFGSARTPCKDDNYTLAQKVSEKLVEKGFMVITGAGGGIMEAGNKGAEENGLGVNIELSFETANPFIENTDRVTSFKYFFNRKVTFIKESDGIILFPGGFGTHDEGFEILTLIQTGICDPRPVILISKPTSSYWDKWVHFVKSQLVKGGYIDKNDTHIFKLVKSADDAVYEIERFRINYHSIYYGQDSATIFLKHPLSDSHLTYINSNFSAMLQKGEFTFSKTYPQHLSSQDISLLHQLHFCFNHKSYSALYTLIDFLNTIS